MTASYRCDVVHGKGMVGDGFFGKVAHMDAAVTLMAIESLEAIAAELALYGSGADGLPTPARGWTKSWPRASRLP